MIQHQYTERQYNGAKAEITKAAVKKLGVTADELCEEKIKALTLRLCENRYGGQQ